LFIKKINPAIFSHLTNIVHIDKATTLVLF